MPYPFNHITELPNAIQEVLPIHAQELYKEAFNSAWDQYKDEDNRPSATSREETAHRFAWSTVKKGYVKDKKTGKWVHYIERLSKTT